MQTIDRLRTLRDNWDGYGSPAPSEDLTAYARETLVQMREDVLRNNLRWQEPHFSANERGQITLEWWQEERTLTVFFRSLDQIDYLKSWGNNIETEMEDGSLTNLGAAEALLRWLHHEVSEKNMVTIGKERHERYETGETR